VPVLHHLEMLLATNTDDAKLISNFLSELFIRFQYKMYAPGSVLINFSDPPDRLLFFVSGQVYIYIYKDIYIYLYIYLSIDIDR
jgi:hypothetical protein